MSDVTRLTRYPDRASTDRGLLDVLLDEVLVATVSTVVDGQPWSLPIFFGRDGDRVLIHGSTGSGLLRHLEAGNPATLTVYALDAVVVAQTAFESSANYRSAVLRGTFESVARADRDEALRILTDRLIPGRPSEVPPSTPKELAATTVLALTIAQDNWIYKARTGPSGCPDPLVRDVWVGVVPMKLTAGDPIKDAWVDDDVPVPPSVQALVQRHG